MKSLLDDLYYGKISPWELHPSGNLDAAELNRKISDEERYFVQKMSVDDADRFQNLTNLYLQSNGFAASDSFACGFKLGTGLMLEVLAEN